MQQIEYIKTNQLHESSINPRKEFDQAAMDELLTVTSVRTAVIGSGNGCKHEQAGNAQ